MLNADTTTDTKNQEENQEDLGKEYDEMFKAGVHFGYSRSSRHPGMKPFLYGIRNNVEIFDLEKVYSCLQKACAFMKELGQGKKTLLLVATKVEARNIAEKTAKELNIPYVTERWLGGTLTNLKIIKSQIDYYEKLFKEKESGEFSKKYTKKEGSRLDKRMSRMDKKFGGIRFMRDLPSAMLVIDPKDGRLAVIEAKKTGVPVIAIMNSDCNPKGIDYPVPGNDAALSSIEYLLARLSACYGEGQKN